MAKLFYTTEEAAKKLNVGADEIKPFVMQNKVREFRDGPKVMYKVDQIDRLAQELATAAAAPVGDDSDLEDALDLDLAAAPTEPSAPMAPVAKAVVAPVAPPVAPASSFDDLDLSPIAEAAPVRTPPPAPSRSAVAMTVPVEPESLADASEGTASDTAALTQIQAMGETPISLDAVGSGSGLLDLTRENDDTSLGAELLDEIYPPKEAQQLDGIGTGSGIFNRIEESHPPVGDFSDGGGSFGQPAMETASPEQPILQAAFVEEYDPSSSIFGGLAAAASLAMLLAVVSVLAGEHNLMPDWLEFLATHLPVFAGSLAGVTVLLTIGGWIVGKVFTPRSAV